MLRRSLEATGHSATQGRERKGFTVRSGDARMRAVVVDSEDRRQVVASAGHALLAQNMVGRIYGVDIVDVA